MVVAKIFAKFTQNKPLQYIYILCTFCNTKIGYLPYEAWPIFEHEPSHCPQNVGCLLLLFCGVTALRNLLQADSLYTYLFRLFVLQLSPVALS